MAPLATCCPASASIPTTTASRPSTNIPGARSAADADPLEGRDQRSPQCGDQDRDHERDRELGEEDDTAEQPVRRDRDHDQTPRPGGGEVQPHGTWAREKFEVRRRPRPAAPALLAAQMRELVGEALDQPLLVRRLWPDPCRGARRLVAHGSNPRAAAPPVPDEPTGRLRVLVGEEARRGQDVLLVHGDPRALRECEPPSTWPTSPRRPAPPPRAVRAAARRPTDQKTDLAEVLAGALDDAALGTDHHLAATGVPAQGQPGRLAGDSSSMSRSAPSVGTNPTSSRRRSRLPPGRRARGLGGGDRRPAHPGRPRRSGDPRGGDDLPIETGPVPGEARTSRLEGGVQLDHACTSVVAPRRRRRPCHPRRPRGARPRSARRPGRARTIATKSVRLLRCLPPMTWERKSSRIAAAGSSARGRRSRHDVGRQHERDGGPGSRDLGLRVNVAGDDDRPRPAGASSRAHARIGSGLPPSVPPVSRTTSGALAVISPRSSPRLAANTATTLPPQDERDPAPGLGGTSSSLPTTAIRSPPPALEQARVAASPRARPARPARPGTRRTRRDVGVDRGRCSAAAPTPPSARSTSRALVNVDPKSTQTTTSFGEDLRTLDARWRSLLNHGRSAGAPYREGTVEVRDQVVDGLDADAEPDQSAGTLSSVPATLMWSSAGCSIGSRRRPGTPRGRTPRRAHASSAACSPPTAEGHDPAEALHLPGRDLVTGWSGSPGK